MPQRCHGDIELVKKSNKDNVPREIERVLQYTLTGNFVSSERLHCSHLFNGKNIFPANRPHIIEQLNLVFLLPTCPPVP
jgi:hypothetical protein